MAEQVSLRRQQDEEERRGGIIETRSEPEFDNIMVRKPLCTRCRNHGLKTSLKGHKHSCFFKLCMCDRCTLIKDRSVLNRGPASTPVPTPVQHEFSSGSSPGYNTSQALFPNHNPSLLTAILRICNNDVGQTIYI